MDNQNPTRGSITARIIDYQKGMNIIQNIRGVRIHSNDYVLLIMEDYVPTLGKVDGKVVFLTLEDEIVYENVKGFYKHQYNEFTILLEEKEQKKTNRNAEESDTEEGNTEEDNTEYQGDRKA